MTSKKFPVKRSREPSESSDEGLPDIALAAIVSYKKHEEVTNFINFFLEALERNSDWLNSIVGKQNNFKCAFMAGAGPHRFQLQKVIYPTNDEDVKLEVELKDSEDYDKFAIAALLKLSNPDIENLLSYIKTRLFENGMLKEYLLKGKAMGVNFAVLRPFSDKQYRLVERIVVSNSKCPSPIKKKRHGEKLFIGPPIKKTRRVV